MGEYDDAQAQVNACAECGKPLSKWEYFRCKKCQKKYDDYYKEAYPL